MLHNLVKKIAEKKQKKQLIVQFAIVHKVRSLFARHYKLGTCMNISEQVHVYQSRDKPFLHSFACEYLNNPVLTNKINARFGTSGSSHLNPKCGVFAPS